MELMAVSSRVNHGASKEGRRGGLWAEPTIRSVQSACPGALLDAVIPYVIYKLMSKLPLAVLVTGCALAFSQFAQAEPKEIDPSKLPPASTKANVSFDSDIRPIFEKSCFGCHGPDTAKPKGKLRVDTVANVVKGSEDGPVVIAGNSAKSPLIASVAHAGDPDDYMPPPKNKDKIPPLTAEQVGLIRAWIDQGAK